ncbi:MAG: pantoate--beta-alanine ligase [Acidimicrobiales bacterium]|jgi:pantoate--beta-alanine ligase
MEIVTTRSEFRAAMAGARRPGSTLGLVPTMGALHEGHLSLLRTAAASCDAVAMSIFVNPLQFSSADDLAKYPSSLEQDLAMAEDAAVAIAFTPSVDEMYPRGHATTMVKPGPIGALLEGASRPGFFAGAATAVAKLLSLSGSCRAFFGEKDFQQLAIVRQLVVDLDLEAEIVGCPTVREADGLACSSRNRRLGAQDRQAATVLFRALTAGVCAAASGAHSVTDLEATMRTVVAAEPRARLDYAVVVDPATFQAAPFLAGELRLLIAADVGPVRLIDNLGVVI